MAVSVVVQRLSQNAFITIPRDGQVQPNELIRVLVEGIYWATTESVEVTIAGPLPGAPPAIILQQNINRYLTTDRAWLDTAAPLTQGYYEITVRSQGLFTTSYAYTTFQVTTAAPEPPAPPPPGGIGGVLAEGKSLITFGLIAYGVITLLPVLTRRIDK